MNGKYRGKLEQRYISREKARLEHIRAKRKEDAPAVHRYVQPPAPAEKAARELQRRSEPELRVAIHRLATHCAPDAMLKYMVSYEGAHETIDELVLECADGYIWRTKNDTVIILVHANAGKTECDPEGFKINYALLHCEPKEEDA